MAHTHILVMFLVEENQAGSWILISLIVMYNYYDAPWLSVTKRSGLSQSEKGVPPTLCFVLVCVCVCVLGLGGGGGRNPPTLLAGYRACKIPL